MCPCIRFKLLYSPSLDLLNSSPFSTFLDMVFFGSFGDIVTSIELIIKVVRTFRDNGGLVDNWSAEMDFVLVLRSTLGRLTHLAKTTPHKSYSRDLAILSQGISRHLTSFGSFLEKHKPSLELAANPSTYHRVKQTIKLSLSDVFGKVEGLHKDIDQQLQNMNSVLMLYTIDNLTSQPSMQISQDQLSDLKSAMKLTNAPLAHQFNELARLVSERRPNNQSQQKCLLAMKSDAQQNHNQLQRRLKEMAKIQTQTADQRHREQMNAVNATNTQVSRVAQNSQMQLQATRQIAASMAQTKRDDRHSQAALQNTLNSIKNQGRESGYQVTASVNRLGKSTDQQMAIAKDTKTTIDQTAKSTAQQLHQQTSSIKQQTAVTAQIAKSNEKFQAAQMKASQKTSAQLIADRKASEVASKAREASNLEAFKQSLKQSDAKKQTDRKAIQTTPSKPKMSRNEPTVAQSLKPRGHVNNQGPKNEVSTEKALTMRGLSPNPGHRVSSATQANSHGPRHGENSSFYNGAGFGGSHHNTVGWQTQPIPRDLTKPQHPVHHQTRSSERGQNHLFNQEQPQKHLYGAHSDRKLGDHNSFKGNQHVLSSNSTTGSRDLHSNDLRETWPHGQSSDDRYHHQETHGGYIHQVDDHDMTQNQHRDFQSQHSSQSHVWYDRTEIHVELNQQWDGGDHDLETHGHGDDNLDYTMSQNKYGDSQSQPSSPSIGSNYESSTESSTESEAGQTLEGEQYEDLEYTGHGGMNGDLSSHEHSNDNSDVGPSSEDSSEDSGDEDSGDEDSGDEGSGDEDSDDEDRVQADDDDAAGEEFGVQEHSDDESGEEAGDQEDSDDELVDEPEGYNGNGFYEPYGEEDQEGCDSHSYG
ncbi:hypothetical protein B0O99DRAFT_600389 [Bisporella sp. PMI_857]|nr:hypothetical protein B0O99DRAFT_600389 [Bisporella sp. PMI_857]